MQSDAIALYRTTPAFCEAFGVDSELRGVLASLDKPRSSCCAVSKGRNVGYEAVFHAIIALY